MILKKEVSIQVSEDEIADLFMDLASDQQANVLELIGRRSQAAWGQFHADGQWLIVGGEMTKKDLKGAAYLLEAITLGMKP